MGSRYDAMKQYKKSENKGKKELKALRKQNNVLYSVFKKSILCRELKKIKKIRAKSSNNRYDYSSDSSSDE